MSQQPFSHLAIVPDGNRRWAKQHGIGSEKKVYEQGSETTFEIIKAAFEAGIPHVTFWASSYANLLARPRLLVDAIESVFVRKFHELATHPLIHENKVKVAVYGEWREILKPGTVKAVEESIYATSHYTDRHLTVLVGYDGQRERGAAIIEVLRAAKDSPSQLVREGELIDAANLLRRHAWTGHLPDVDLIVRTGSWVDPHNSTGFLSLIAGDAQYAFPEVLWPDFSAGMLNDIITNFLKRERRMGR